MWGGGGDGRNRGGGYGKGNGGDGGGGDGGTAVGWGRKEDGGLGYGTKGKRKDLVIHIHKAMGASKTTRQSSGKGFKLSFPILCRGVDVAIPLPCSAASSSPSTSTSPSLRSKARVQELREVFRHFDGDHDGKISADELRSFFTSIGEGMSPEEAEGVIADLNSDGHGLLDSGGFLALMERDGMDEDLRKVFEMFEAMNGSGRITPWGLQRMLNRLGDERSYEECEAMIQACDLDGNGEGPVGKRREEAAGWKNPWTGNNGGRQLWRDQ